MKALHRMLLLLALGLPASALAQNTQVAFGGLKHDTSLPVEMSGDKLTVDQADGSAIFSGNVMIGQGDMRITAGKVRVEYKTDTQDDATGKIARLLLSDGVSIVNGSEAAEAQQAEYSIDSGTIVMTGSVILTQGANALSSERMVIDLKTGSAVLEGRVKTIFQPGSGN